LGHCRQIFNRHFFSFVSDCSHKFWKPITLELYSKTALRANGLSPNYFAAYPAGAELAMQAQGEYPADLAWDSDSNQT